MIKKTCKYKWYKLYKLFKWYRWCKWNDTIQMVQYKWYDTKDTIQIIQIKWYYKNNSSENKWVTNSIEEFAISRLKQTKADIFDAKVSQHL